MSKFALIGFLCLLVGTIFAACGTETIIKTVEVERIVEVEKIVQVEKEVVVTEREEILVEVEKEKIVVVERDVEVEVEVEVEKVVEVTQVVPAYKGVDSDRYGGNLRVVAQASIGTLDCMFACGYVTMAVTDHVHEKLFAYDLNVTPKPVLTDSWSVSNNGQTYTFTLRDGIKFHNGDDLTAADVVESYNRASPDIATGKFLNDRLSEIVAVDDLTIRMEFTEPIGVVLDALASPWPQFNVLPKAVAMISTDEDHGEENLIGVGPYKLSDWEHGNKLTLIRYEGYQSRSEDASGLYGRKGAYLDSIEWLEVPSEQTKITGLEAGQWDVVDGAGLDFYEQLKKNPDIDIKQYPFQQNKVVLNTKIGITSNKLIRQAIQAAVDVDFFMAALGPKDLWFTCSAQYYCGTGLETAGGSELYDQGDADRARELLAEAGYNGETVKIVNPTDYATIGFMGQVMKPTLEAIGMTVDMPSIDWSTVISELRSENPDWNIFNTWYALWTTPNPVADTVPAGIQSGGDNWDVDTAKALVAEFAAELDKDKQLAIIDRLQLHLKTEVPEITLGQWSSIYPHRSNILGIVVPTSPMYFNAWID